MYDVDGPLPTADGRPPLFMIGQPMTAGGFGALASHFPDRTVVTYDPRGLGRSTRRDGRDDHSPSVQATDVHAVIETLGAGPVEMFASSGGAVTALAVVAAHPGDVVTLVAHEPPLIPVLPDAAAAERARAGVRDVYEAKGSGAGWAKYSSVYSPRHDVIAMNAAMPAPQPLAWYASRTPAWARRAASASGSTAISGGSWATRVVTSPGWAATSASAVTAPPLLANISTGPTPSASMRACRSPAWTFGALSTRPSLRTLRPSPRGS